MMEGREGEICNGPQGDVVSRPDISELGSFPPDHKSTAGSCPCSCSSSKQLRKDEEFGEMGMQGTTTIDVEEVVTTTEDIRTRKWKYFQGNNHFYCDGRIMTAPSIRYFSLSFALILLTFGLFIAFDAPFLTRRLTVAIPIVSSILFVLVISNMLRTSCSDPGIIPRASLAEVEYMERSYGNSAATYRPPPRTKDIIVNGQVIKSKYCFTCKMFRPPRASHCSICDNCVERFDHHCPFLGNCVGRRNYRSFYFFVVSLSLLAILILSCSITHLALLAKDHGDFLVALRDSPTSAVVILISFFGMWTVIGLAGFHTYLIAVEQTTNEDIKGIFGRPNSKNPYSRGSTCSNCCYILCGPYPSSLLDPRGVATPDFLSSIQRPKTVQAGGAVQQQPARAPVHNSASFGISQYPVSPASNGVDINHLTQRNQEQQGVPLRQMFSPANQSQLKPNGILAPQAGTFPESQTIGYDYLTNGRLMSNKKMIGNGNSLHLSNSSSQLNPSINSFQDEFPNDQLARESLSMVQLHPRKSQIPPSQRRNKDEGGGSTVSSSLRTSPSAASLERLTMINSPLHLDPVM